MKCSVSFIGIQFLSHNNFVSRFKIQVIPDQVGNDEMVNKTGFPLEIDFLILSLLVNTNL